MPKKCDGSESKFNNTKIKKIPKKVKKIYKKPKKRKIYKRKTSKKQETVVDDQKRMQRAVWKHREISLLRVRFCIFVGPEDLWLTERPLRQTITGAGVLKNLPGD